jgi:hypothetical protein
VDGRWEIDSPFSTSSYRSALRILRKASLMSDILCIPFEQWGAALLYFTGNDIVRPPDSTPFHSTIPMADISLIVPFACMPGRRGTASTNGACIKV